MFRRSLDRIAAAIRNLSLTAKGILVVAIPVCALLAAMAVFYQYQQKARAAQGWVEHTFQFKAEIRQVLVLLTTAENAARGYLLSHRESYLEPYNAARQQLPDTLQAIAVLAANDEPEQRERLDKAQAAITVALADLEELRKYAEEDSLGKGAQQLEQGRATMATVRRELEAMQTEEQRLLDRRQRTERQEERYLRRAVLFGGIGGLLGAVMAALLFTGSIVRRVQRLQEDAWRVARGIPVKGKLSGGDEIGRLEQTLRETSRRLSAQSEELLAARNELESRVAQRTAELVVANEELRQSNEVRQALIKSSPLAIWAIDLDGRVTFWNPAAERIFGFSEAEVIGKTLPVIPEGERPQFFEWLEKLRCGEPTVAMERARQKKDGSLIDVSIWTGPLRDATGAISGTIALDADITQRKQLEEQFRQSQKLEAVGQLAGGVAHDFNNLLTVILGYVELQIAESNSVPAVVEYAQEIQYAAGRASALTGQLLAFSRRQISQPKVLDLNDIVSRAVKLLSRLIGEDIEVVTRLAPSLGMVRVDPLHIDQVMMNLAVNARDAMEEGGRLTIETANVLIRGGAPSGPLDMAPGRYVTLAISDTGVGMNPEVKARLFEPFFTTKGPGKGTGLGLSIVYGIVKQSGGHVVVSSEAGQGTSIQLYFPLAEESSGRAEIAKEGLALRGTETVLVCEDERHIRKLVHSMLSKQGYQVLAAESAAEALRLSGHYAGEIDLLLTDIVMPRSNGVDLANAIRERRPAIKVLYMSGYADSHASSAWVLDAKAPFLHKPFTAAALMLKVREALGTEVMGGNQGR